MDNTSISKSAWGDYVALGFAGAAGVLIGWAAFRRTRNRASAGVDTDQTAFLTTVAHELQIPITSIRGLSTVLLDSVPAGGEAADYAARIARNAEAVASLVADLLEFSRPGQGELSLATDAVDLSSLARSVLEQLATVAAHHRIRLEVEPGVTVKGDPDALVRILSNLVGNAVKFSPPATEIVVTVRPQGGTGTLSVADEGPGIHEDDKNRLFERLLPRVTPRDGSTPRPGNRPRCRPGADRAHGGDGGGHQWRAGRGTVHRPAPSPLAPALSVGHSTLGG